MALKTPTKPYKLRKAVLDQWNRVMALSDERQLFNLRVIQATFPHRVTLNQRQLNGDITIVSQWCSERFGPDPLIYPRYGTHSYSAREPARYHDTNVLGDFVLVIEQESRPKTSSSIQMNLYGFFRDSFHAFETRLKWG
ncbi:MAG: hypothetical protein EOP83_08585 [Verrucomicrobiaceae bacterium]|nr:MAG: hypothetical protein EOP83_08585 [Verrucomicrobiaceae bacterium]